MPRRWTLLLSVLAVGCAACGAGGGVADGAPAGAGRLSTVASGLHVPWGIAFLPSGAALVAQRTTGTIVRIAPGGGAKRTVMRVPGVLRGTSQAGEGGLLGLAVSPHYARDRWVYAYFTTPRDNRIARFHLGGRLHPILTGLGRAEVHNGGRIAFGPDGKLYATVGENGNPALAQSLRSRNGKILRIDPDGSIPRSNPFKHSAIWSYGHRNPQGLAWDARGRLWSAELGQDRFDEVNLIRPGRNYGWPVVEGRGSTHGGRYVNPKAVFRTSNCSPSGDAIIHSQLYVACLGGQRLYRFALHGTRLGHRVRLLYASHGRLRTVVRAPSGRLWISTSNRDDRGTPQPGDDKILSLEVP